MIFYWLLLFLSTCLTPAQSAYNCTACSERKCLPVFSPCPGNRAIDPCGCCEHCAKQRGQPCGGPDWELGYCDKDFICAAVIGHGHVVLPMNGVCKPADTRKEYFEDHDENCPERHGCYRAMGICDCITKRTCILDFFQYTPQMCDPRFDVPDFDNAYYDIPAAKPCTRSGCDIVDEACVCGTSGCDRNYEFSDQSACRKELQERKCANVTCPVPAPLHCPRDSVPVPPYTPPGECCPTMTSACTCEFERCNTKCPRVKRKIMIWKSDGAPGRCCDRFLCLL